MLLVRTLLERGILMVKKLSFAHLVGAVLAFSFILGFAVFVLSATTNK